MQDFLVCTLAGPLFGGRALWQEKASIVWVFCDTHGNIDDGCTQVESEWAALAPLQLARIFSAHQFRCKQRSIYLFVLVLKQPPFQPRGKAMNIGFASAWSVSKGPANGLGKVRDRA